MNNFLTLSATSVTMCPNSLSASTVCAGTGFTHFSFANLCKNFAASRRAVSEFGLRLRALLALAVVCAASLFCESGASAQTTNGVVTAWGNNGDGQCTIPASANNGVSAIAGGGGHTILTHLPP